MTPTVSGEQLGTDILIGIMNTSEPEIAAVGDWLRATVGKAAHSIQHSAVSQGNGRKNKQ